LKKLIIYILNLPLYYFSILIPKNKNIWIFGAWFGNQYNDNSKELFEYVNLNHKDINAIWLTQSDDILVDMTRKGFKVYRTYSIQGYLYTMMAKYIFVSTGMADVNRYVATTRYKIQLWHGTPLKKIQDDVSKNTKNTIQIIKDIVLPFNKSNYEYMTIPSKNTERNFKSAFSNVKNFEITGYPRNDALKQYTKTKKIIYLPTHRGEGKGSIENIFKTFNIEKINETLKKIGYELIVKMHFYDLSRISFDNQSNIKFLRESMDPYELLQESTILITDYSSIYFDFLLTQRPIIFTPFDIEEYQKKDREFYYNYEDVTPGPKCQDWNEVLIWIEMFVKDITLFEKERKEVNKKFNKFDDFKNSERVYQMIKEKCNA
jgi:CDP-glycerol glycerophosphotransferase (TagB/SpsB family)